MDDQSVPQVSISAQLERGLFLFQSVADSESPASDGNRTKPERIGNRLLFVNNDLSNNPNDQEYTKHSDGEISVLLSRAKAFLKDLVEPQVSAACALAHKEFLECFPEGLLVEVGGGPNRSYGATNLNIGAWPGVDIVADAHKLPYKDCSVEKIMSRAVLEHLEDPLLAVQEMFRVLKPGGYILLATPFLQPYHGYPHHYQGFTLHGQSSLANKCGFQAKRTGIVYGPNHTVSHILRIYLENYVPMGKLISYLWMFTIGLLLTKADRFLWNHRRNYVLCFGSFYFGFKPQS